MATPNSSFSELLSVTMQKIDEAGGLIDSVSNLVPSYDQIKKADQIRMSDGGPQIQVPIEFAENGTYTRFQAAEPINMSPQEVFTSTNAAWKQIGISITAHGQEVRQNSGRSQVFDLVKMRLRNARNTAMNNLDEDIQSDGASDGGRQITGYATLIPTDPTTGIVQGLNRGTYTFWRPQLYRATTDGGAAMSAANIQTHMNAMWRLIAAVKGKTSYILAEDDAFGYFETSLQAIQRATDTTKGQLGYDSYAYKSNIPVIYTPSGTGIADKTMLFIDKEAVALYVHKDANWTALPERHSYNQEVMGKILVWMGNLVAINSRKLGRLNNA